MTGYEASTALCLIHGLHSMSKGFVVDKKENLEDAFRNSSVPLFRFGVILAQVSISSDVYSYLSRRGKFCEVADTQVSAHKLSGGSVAPVNSPYMNVHKILFLTSIQTYGTVLSL
jgi:hypothetical protein